MITSIASYDDGMDPMLDPFRGLTKLLFARASEEIARNNDKAFALRSLHECTERVDLLNSCHPMTRSWRKKSQGAHCNRMPAAFCAGCQKNCEPSHQQDHAYYSFYRAYLKLELLGRAF